MRHGESDDAKTKRPPPKTIYPSPACPNALLRNELLLVLPLRVNAIFDVFSL